VIKKLTFISENFQIHSVHKIFSTNLHPRMPNLTKFQKGVYCSGIEIFNNLPHNIKDISNEIKLFQNAFKEIFTVQTHFIIEKNILIIRNS
jgi:hypothetical protein